MHHATISEADVIREHAQQQHNVLDEHHIRLSDDELIAAGIPVTIPRNDRDCDHGRGRMLLKEDLLECAKCGKRARTIAEMDAHPALRVDWINGHAFIEHEGPWSDADRDALNDLHVEMEIANGERCARCLSGPQVDRDRGLCVSCVEEFAKARYKANLAARGPLNLAEIVEDVMALHPESSRDEIEKIIIVGVGAVRGPLNAWWQAKVGVEVGLAFNAREQRGEAK